MYSLGGIKYITQVFCTYKFWFTCSFFFFFFGTLTLLWQLKQDRKQGRERGHCAAGGPGKESNPGCCSHGDPSMSNTQVAVSSSTIPPYWRGHEWTLNREAFVELKLMEKFFLFLMNLSNKNESFLYSRVFDLRAMRTNFSLLLYAFISKKWS